MRSSSTTSPRPSAHASTCGRSPRPWWLLAVGAAIADGTRLRGRPLAAATSPIWPYFPEFLERQPPAGRENLRAAVRLRHLLTSTTGHARGVPVPSGRGGPRSRVVARLHLRPRARPPAGLALRVLERRVVPDLGHGARRTRGGPAATVVGDLVLRHSSGSPTSRGPPTAGTRRRPPGCRCRRSTSPPSAGCSSPVACTRAGRWSQRAWIECMRYARRAHVQRIRAPGCGRTATAWACGSATAGRTTATGRAVSS